MLNGWIKFESVDDAFNMLQASSAAILAIYLHCREGLHWLGVTALGEACGAQKVTNPSQTAA